MWVGFLVGFMELSRDKIHPNWDNYILGCNAHVIRHEMRKLMKRLSKPMEEALLLVSQRPSSLCHEKTRPGWGKQ